MRNIFLTFLFFFLFLLNTGNDNIHLISTYGHHELSIYMENPKTEHRWGNYSTFSLANEMSNYNLTVTGFTGNVSCKSPSFCSF